MPDRETPPPIGGDGSFTTERRFWLRRLRVRRRVERPGSDRRVSERRQSHQRSRAY